MTVTVQFYSCCKELTGCAQVVEKLPAGATIEALLQQLHARFPRLVPMRNSTLIAVGVDYQPRSHVLKEGDEVSLFPPLQGG